MNDSVTPEARGEVGLFAQYLQMLSRRRWIVLACVLIGIAIAVALTLTTTRLYRATATVQIDREAARVTNIEGVEPTSQAGGQEFYQTQYGLLRSRALAELVVRKLRLADNPALLYGYAKASGDTAGSSAPRAQREQRAAGIILAHLNVAPVRGSSLVALSFDSPDPRLSAQIVNAIGANFIAQTLNRRFEATADARQWLENKLAETRAKLEDSERNVVGYAAREGIINIELPTQPGSTGPSGESSLAATDLGALDAALATAKADRIAAQARYEAGRGRGAGLAESMADPAIGSLRTRRAELFGEYQRQSAVYGADYPTMRALSQQIAAIDQQIGGQTGNVVSSLRNNYLAAQGRESGLQSQVDSLKGQLLDQRRRSIQYNIYKRDADTNRTLYDGLLQRYKEIGIAGAIGANNVSVVDEALPPGAPFTPRPLLNLILGILGGLLAGVAIALILEQLDESIAAPHDLEGKLGVPLLGSVPRSADGDAAINDLVDPKSPVAEAYLSILTALRFSTDHGVPSTLLFTSSRPSEGKSTSTIAVAANLTKLGRRVVVVDGDLRNPSIHRSMGLSNSFGFSDALAGSDDVARMRQHAAAYGFDVITTGTLPPNPAELLSGPRLAQVIEMLRGHYDHVVIDGPPVIGLADAPLIAHAVEATVFVVAARETRGRPARIALKRLQDAHARVIGGVLTKFDSRQVGYGYDYGYSYAYGSRDRASDAPA